MFFSHCRSVTQQRTHKVTACPLSCVQFIWWSGDQRGPVLGWEIEVRRTRGSGLQYASTCHQTGIVGRQSVLSRLVSSVVKTIFHILWVQAKVPLWNYDVILTCLFWTHSCLLQKTHTHARALARERMHSLRNFRKIFIKPDVNIIQLESTQSLYITRSCHKFYQQLCLCLRWKWCLCHLIQNFRFDMVTYLCSTTL